MSGLTWLHISDWHHKDFPIDPEVVRDRLVEDIKKRAAISRDLDKIDFIIFSGDVVTGGRAEEYKQAKKEFFDHILKAASLSPSQLFIVPGNHDLDEAEIKKLPDEFQKNAASKEDADLWLNDATKREQLLRPFRDFKSFVSDYTNQDSPDYSNVRTWEIEDKKVSLLGINSAWWCRHHKDESGKPKDFGFLLVGERQILEPLKITSQSNLRIAVLHHSQDWFDYFDGKRVWSRLRQECNFILHGHGHEPEVTEEHGTKGDCIIIPAGASFELRTAKDPKHINSYNYVHLDLETDKGTVFLRRWNDERSKWVKDDQTYPDGEFPINIHGDVDYSKGSSHSSSAPHQIRPPPKDFTGREKEIEALLKDFERGAVIAGLRGMGGVGKTALARVLAEKLVGRYPDGQILVDMKGTDKKPLSWTEAMIQIIHAYEPKYKMPLNEGELPGKYFSTLHGKKALLLLDNAARREQVEPLLPPAGSALLITSRNKFALAGLKEKDLDVLPQEDAKKLLLEILGRIGEDAEELANLCGRLPLALRNAAYALKEKLNLSPAGYINRLGDARKRLELVEASFSLSYELLAPELQRLWCLLSVFPADFDLGGAAAVWETEQESTEDRLGDLVKWSLVDYMPPTSGEGGRYKLHDLARDFTGSHLDDVARELARLRHAGHFMVILSNADRLFEQGGENQIRGLDLFEIEWPNIQAGLLWAEICPQRLPVIDGICCDYPNAGASILFLRRHPQELIRWYKNAIDAAQRLNNSSLVAASLGGMANAQKAIGNSHEAIRYYEQALAISRKIRDKRGEASNLAGLGGAHAALSDNPKAIEYLEQALLISRKNDDQNAEAANLAGLGRAHAALSDNPKAIEYFEQALPISRETGDQRGEAANLAGLGRAHEALSDYRKSIEYFEQALPISKKIGNERGEAANLAGLGRAHAAASDHRKAIEYFEQALPISKKIGNKRGEAADLAGLGRAHAALSDHRKAIDYFKQALAISKKIGNKKDEATNLAGLGHVYVALSDYIKAIEYFEQALAISKKIEDKKGESRNFSFMGNTHAELGNIDKAVEYYELSLGISREMGDRKGEADYLFSMSLSLEKLGPREKAIDLAKTALEIFEQIKSPNAETVRKKLAEWGA
jgi:tetratricopeptide (TPR) repeat protein/predicted phosphodiesterase